MAGKNVKARANKNQLLEKNVKGYSKASQRQGVSSLQSVSTAGTRSLGNRQGIYEFFLPVLVPIV